MQNHLDSNDRSVDRSGFIFVFGLALALWPVNLNAVFEGVEIGAGIGYTTTLTITEPSGGSPALADEGVLYDLLSPSIYIAARIKPISIGLIGAYQFADGIFGIGQDTDFKSFSLGLKTVYNFEATDSAEWLIPIEASFNRRWMQIDYQTPGRTVEVEGDGYEAAASFGFERVFPRGHSLGFSIGRAFIWSEFVNEEFAVHPKADIDGWRFTMFTRFIISQ